MPLKAAWVLKTTVNPLSAQKKFPGSDRDIITVALYTANGLATTCRCKRAAQSASARGCMHRTSFQVLRTGAKSTPATRVRTYNYMPPPFSVERALNARAHRQERKSIA